MTSEIGTRGKSPSEQQSRWEAAFQGAPTGMALVGLDGRFLAVNPSLCEFLRRDEPTLLASGFQSLTHPEDLAAALEAVERLVAGDVERYRTESRYLLPDGSVAWGSLNLSLVRDANDEPRYFVAQIEDIAVRKEVEHELARYTEHLNQLALRDPLTGLANYRDFHATLDLEFERCLENGTECSVVLFDVDGFRALNERDYSEGDRVLFEVASAIAAGCGHGGLAARIGGDEFSLVLPEMSREDALHLAQQIVARVAERAGGASLSFGSGSCPVDGHSKELVLVRADMQLHAATLGANARSEAAPEVQANPSGDQYDAIHKLLFLARQQLGMDVAYVARFDTKRQMITAVAGDASSFGLKEGDSRPLATTYCKRVIAGEIPNAIPDARADPALSALSITTEMAIGAYVGVPLRLANGHLYGILCALSHARKPELADHHVELLDLLADLITSHIDDGGRAAAAHRSDVEFAGIDALMGALVARDHYTGAHSKIVVELAARVARRLGLAEDQVREVEQVALLHDVGKVGVPDSVLQKTGPLTDKESALMRQHPAIGARIVAGAETLAHLAPAVKAEHERYDGTGYPDGLRGDAIPLASRIVFACDAYHAMTSDRPYRPALDLEVAIAELHAGSGTQFDPSVIRVLLETLDATAMKTPLGAQTATPAARADVLSALMPSQMPVWEPSSAIGSTTIIGDVRARCLHCGTHVKATINHATLGGNCTNCGSYELELLKM